jgi:hypothetical protein
MSIEQVLSTIIGMLVIWIITSMVVMSVHEWLANRFRWRAKMLESTIRNMLSDFALADQLYNHPLIRSLYSGEDGTAKPSYIPSSQFAQAIMDIILNASTEASLMQYYLYKLRWELFRLGKKQREEAQKRLNVILALTRRVLVSQADETSQEAAMEDIRNALESLGEDFPPLKPSIESAITTVTVQHIQIREAIKAGLINSSDETTETANNRYRKGLAGLSITHPRLKQILGALLSELTNASIETESIQMRARQNVEEWFNNSMDRVSGWYRRRAQTLAYVLAIGLAFALNIDSVHIFNALWKDDYLRTVVSSQGQSMVVENPDGITQEQFGTIVNNNSDVWLHLPIGWIGLSGGVETYSADSSCYWGPNPASLRPGLFLLGRCYPLLNGPVTYDPLGWATKILGLLITGVAAAQGAPFWFDVLKKVINVRIAGINPAEVKRAVG